MFLFPEAWIHWAPTLLVVGIALGLLPFLDRNDPRARLLLCAGAVAVTLRYFWWRFSETLAPPGWTWDALASWSFFCIEASAGLASLSAFTMLSRIRHRSSEADAHAHWYGETEPAVAILIATYNEEWAVLERTIAGALATEYGNKSIYMLDDGRRAWLADECARLGVIHVTRPDNSHGKAGNINHMLDRFRDSGRPPDFIAVLDADFVPHKNFVSRILSLFHAPDVGLVQTPQHFFNPDPIQHNLGISRSYPDEQRFFFDHLQPSRDAWGIAVCCGTSSMIRWSALETIGGFPTDSVTEDYLLTLALQVEGYRTVYLNEPLSEGLAPEGLKEYITQRARWCLGLMQIVRSRFGPLGSASLRWRDRWSMLDSCVYWLTTFVFKLSCFVYPLLYWYFGTIVVDAQLAEVISNFAPYFLGTMVYLNFVSGGLFVPVVNDVSQLIGAFDISKAAFVGLAKPRGHAFKVTMKGGDRTRVVVQWPILQRFLALALLTIGGLLLGLVSDYAFDARAGEGKIVILFWTIYNLGVLMAAIMVCVELPRTAALLRRDPERVEVHYGEQSALVWLADVNLDALRLRGIELPAGMPITADIPAVGTVHAVVEESLAGTTEARLALDTMQRQRLLEKIHTRPGEPGTGLVATIPLAAGLVRRLFAGGSR